MFGCQVEISSSMWVGSVTVKQLALKPLTFLSLVSFCFPPQSLSSLSVLTWKKLSCGRWKMLMKHCECAVWFHLRCIWSHAMKFRCEIGGHVTFVLSFSISPITFFFPLSPTSLPSPLTSLYFLHWDIQLVSARSPVTTVYVTRHNRSTVYLVLCPK